MSNETLSSQTEPEIKVGPNPDGSFDPVLTDKDLEKCGRRWKMAVMGFNYETQLAPSVIFAEADALRKIYADDEEGYKRSLENAGRYFNVTPPVGGLLLGAALAIEDKQHNQGLEAVNDLKVGLMGSMSGIGDSILWTLVPTVMGSIAAYMAQEGNPVGIFLWLAVGLVIFWWSLNNWKTGYKFGTSLITTLADKIPVFTEAMSVLGLTVVGALIPSVVSITVGLTFTMGDVTLNFQEGILDMIMLGIMPVLATWIVYVLIKRRVNLIAIIVAIIVISMVCSAFGILV
ncbi:PTS system mannose/fructose/sorbose family transporter subunit IID [Enorma phocaeensis]|uniref:PTS system mannose/fructose/sorbose family transporter subunit IID n=1 Tax=Enorma phocaeensis TaxID=1871019 RepID=A0A921IVN5_9ACTN|nr:PTS system mannose/fructose/sorbose family transporter subunit IID [Enorma phocaeensis]HJG38094.1 PTS system mannose/fructose/sorbose family transporter subunit IID [Enorma phocaeensis]